MAKWKKYIEAKAKVEVTKKYSLQDGVALVKEVSYSSFVGSCELHVKTAANPKYNDQMIRGTVVLPHGTWNTVRVAAFVADDKKDEAKEAWADVIWNDDLLKAIEDGNIDFDTLVTTPDMMRDLARVAKSLGPKWLMPSPKAWTVSANLSQTINEIKKGRVEFKLDKTGNVHVSVGKINFSDADLIENITTLLKTLSDAKPSGVKGKLIQKICIAPTMGPSVQLDWNE